MKVSVAKFVVTAVAACLFGPIDGAVAQDTPVMKPVHRSLVSPPDPMVLMFSGEVMLQYSKLPTLCVTDGESNDAPLTLKTCDKSNKYQQFKFEEEGTRFPATTRSALCASAATTDPSTILTFCLPDDKGGNFEYDQLKKWLVSSMKNNLCVDAIDASQANQALKASTCDSGKEGQVFDVVSPSQF